ncbi:MAG: hypothetical protein ACLFRV_14715 [Acidimicrobiales bacterium]
MTDELTIHTPDGTYRIPSDELEPYRVDDDPEVSGFDFGDFGHFGIVLKPGQDLNSQPQGGGDLISPRLIGETEKNLGTRPGDRLPGGF